MRGSLNRRTAHNETVDDYRIYWWYMLAAGGLLNIELCTAWRCCICKLLCKRHPHKTADDWRPIRTGTAVSIGLTFFLNTSILEHVALTSIVARRVPVQGLVA